MKRTACIICLLSLLLSAISGCSGGNSSGENGSGKAGAGNASPDASTTAAQTEPAIDEYGRPVLSSSLPDGLDYGGAEVSFLCRETPEFSIDFYVESLNGDIINDAIYQRNAKVQDTLNVRFKYSFVPASNTSNSDSVGDTIRKSVLAGDNEYDISAFYAYYGGATLAMDGMLTNLLDTKYIDLDKPWWNAYFTDTMTLYDQLYYLVGDVNLTATDRLMAIFVNSRLAADYCGGTDALYDEVEAGGWTIERFAQITKDMYKDLNGDGANDNADFYGAIFQSSSIGIDAWVPALGINLVTKDSKGEPALSLYSEHSVEAFDKVYALIRENPGVFFDASNTVNNITAFASGQSAFLCSLLNSTAKLRDMKDTYGLLPYPKFDEAQESYRTNAHDEYNLIGIVSTCSDPEMSAAVLELMSYETYRTVTPAYFEVAMKTKYLADNRSAQMFDIIRSGASFNFGDIYSLTISGGQYVFESEYHAMVRNLIRSGSKTFASTYAKNEPIYKAGLKVLTDKFAEMRG